MRILYRRYIPLFFCFMAVAGLAFSSTAQDEATGEAHSFTAGGRSHVIVYATTETDSPDAALVIDAIRETLPVYNRLWGVESPPIFVKVLGGPAATGSIADATRMQTAVIPVPGTSDVETRDTCLLNIYNNAETHDTDALLFTTAHEIAHCYQAYYMTHFNGFLSGSTDDWWTEGSAEWLATHVYAESESTPTLVAYQEDFIVNHEAGLFDGDVAYDGMFFWSALEQQISTDGAMAFLKAMPEDPADYAAHLMSLPDAGTIFHNYGAFAAENLLAYQPAPEDLFEAAPFVTVEGFPQTVDITTAPFSFNYFTVELPPLEENEGVSVTVSGLSGLDARLSLVGGEELRDGETIRLCPFSPPLRFIISRTENESDERAALVVSSIDCEEAPEGAGDSFACLVGTWHVEEFPPMPGITDVAIVSGNQIVTFAPDGTVSVTTEEFAIRMTGEVVIELTVDSSRVVFTIDSISEDGAISTTPVSTDLGVAFAIVNGTRVSINLNAVGGAVVAPAPLRFDCGADLLFWYFMANGVETRFQLARVETGE